ncbi:MAG TPA: hypothetical protein VFY18_10765 [Candidatus Limnocylindrales bacterium]|nr:hypothetical protein [Candidatus Limnocylindrales bacterium]
MAGSTNGAQRASHRSRIRLVVGLPLIVVLLGSLAAAPTVGATTSSRVPNTSATTLTTTTIDRPWYSTELFYLGLVNCTRTGGWVLSDGTCRGYGSGHYSAYVRPLNLAAGISTAVSRRYAKLLAVRGLCSHYADHDPGYRLRRAGYYRWTWGENVGCRDGYASPKAAVLASHLYYQGEKASNGGHWKNIKNATFLWVGIGIWRYGSRTRLVVDFYRP